MAKIYTDTKAQRAAKAAYDALPIEKKNVAVSEITVEQVVMEEVTPAVTEVVAKVKKTRKPKVKK